MLTDVDRWGIPPPLARIQNCGTSQLIRLLGSRIVGMSQLIRSLGFRTVGMSQLIRSLGSRIVGMSQLIRSLGGHHFVWLGISLVFVFSGGWALCVQHVPLNMGWASLREVGQEFGISCFLKFPYVPFTGGPKSSHGCQQGGLHRIYVKGGGTKRDQHFL